MTISGYHCTYFDIGGLQLATWACEYQPLNIHGELDKMKNWLDANPRRRKKNYRRVIIGWLNKAHAQVVVAQVKQREAYRDAGAGSYREPPAEHVAECERNIAEILKAHPELG